MKRVFFSRLISLLVLSWLNGVELSAQYRQLEKMMNDLDEGNFHDAKDRIMKMDTVDIDEKVFYYRANHLYYVSLKNLEYDPIRAFQFNNRVLSSFKLLSEKEKNKICENKEICEFRIEIEQDKGARLVLSFIKKKQDLKFKGTCLTLLKSYPEYSLVVNWADSLELVEAKNKGSRDALVDYIRGHKGSQYLRLGEILLEDFDFKETLSLNTERAYDEFAKLYPNSTRESFINHKRDSASFQGAELINTIESYRDHLRKHPNGATFNMAKGKIEWLTYQKIKKERTINNADAFLKEFPKSKFELEVKLIKDTLYVNQRLDAFDVDFVVERCRSESVPGNIHCSHVKQKYCQFLVNKGLSQLDLKKLKVLIGILDDCEIAKQLGDSLAERDAKSLLTSSDTLQILEFIKRYPDLNSTKLLIKRLEELQQAETNKEKVVNDQEKAVGNVQKVKVITPVNNASEDEMREVFWKTLQLNTVESYNEYLKNYPNSPYSNMVRLCKLNFAEFDLEIPDLSDISMEDLSNWFLENFKKSKVFNDFVLSDTSYATAIARWAAVNNLFQGQYNTSDIRYFQPYIDESLDDDEYRNVQSIMSFIYRPIYKEYVGYDGLFLYDRSTSSFVQNYYEGQESTVLMDVKTQKVVLENYRSIEFTKNPHCLLVRGKNGKIRLYNTMKRAFVTAEFDMIDEIELFHLKDGSFEKKIVEAMQFQENQLILGFKCTNYSSNKSPGKVVNGQGKELFSGSLMEKCLLKGNLQTEYSQCGIVMGYSMEYYDDKRNSHTKLKDCNFKSDLFPDEISSCGQIDYFSTALIQKSSNNHVLYNFDRQKVLFQLNEASKGNVSVDMVDLPFSWYQYDFPVSNSSRTQYDDSGRIQSLSEMCGYRGQDNVTNITSRLAKEAGAVYILNHLVYPKSGSYQKTCYLVSLDGKKLFESKKDLRVVDSYGDYLAIKFGEGNCGIVDLQGNLIWQTKGDEVRFLNEKFAVYYQVNSGSYKNMGLYNVSDQKVMSDDLYENIYLKKDGIYGIRLGVDSKICDW